MSGRCGSGEGCHGYGEVFVAPGKGANLWDLVPCPRCSDHELPERVEYVQTYWQYREFKGSCPQSVADWAASGACYTREQWENEQWQCPVGFRLEQQQQGVV